MAKPLGHPGDFSKYRPRPQVLPALRVTAPSTPSDIGVRPPCQKKEGVADLRHVAVDARRVP